MNTGNLSRTQSGQPFAKVKNPVIPCTNCLCQYCANNVEELWTKVLPGEMQSPCFICDECRIYDGDCRLKNQRKEACTGFVMSVYGADRNRMKMKVVKGEGNG